MAVNAFGVEDVSKGWFGDQAVKAKILLQAKKKKPKKANLALRPLATLRALSTVKP